MTNPNLPQQPPPPRPPWGPPPPPPRPSNRTRNIVLSAVAAVAVIVVVVVVVILTGGDDNPNGQTNARGSVPVEIGQPITLDSGATMTVTKIEVDPDCSQEQADPDDHTIAVSISAKTPSDMEHDYWSPDQGGAVWDVIDSDGKTLANAGGFPYAPGCMDEEFPDDLGPAQEGEGMVLLSAPTTSGTLIMHERFAPNENYEWTFPAGPTS